MITVSKNANPNYLAKVVKIKNIRKHNNADRLQIVEIDFNSVITGLDTKKGDIAVYFPLESQINKEFLSYTNSFSNKELNKNKNKKGYFSKAGRVKATRLRGEKSMGYIVPIKAINDWLISIDKAPIEFEKHINVEFDTLYDILLVKKYIVKEKESRNIKRGKSPKLNKLIEGQVKLHVDTINLRKALNELDIENHITITYKTHGTSWWCGNLLVKKKVNWFKRILLKLGFNIETTEYDTVYGSRKVVKNKHFEDPKSQDHYFGYDLWKEIAESLPDIPKGYTLYGECLGFDKNGKYIQDDYDYSCNKNDPNNKFKLEIYRITHTNQDGFTTELSWKQIKQFCEKFNLSHSFEYYDGSLINHYLALNDSKSDFKSCDTDVLHNYVKLLEKHYNEKDCFMCNNKVPEEGIVLRVDDLFEYKAYKLKSFRFLEKETKQLDKDEKSK